MNLKYKDWYLNAYNKFMSYTNDPIFIGILSATSPRKSLKANYNLAKKLYLNYLKGITPIFKGISGILPTHKKNIIRAIHGFKLHGDKVSRFYENLMLNLYVVTIDVWVKRYFKTKDFLTPLQYKALESKIKRNARRYGLKPAEYQAVIWNIEREKAGFKPQYF